VALGVWEICRSWLARGELSPSISRSCCGGMPKAGGFLGDGSLFDKVILTAAEKNRTVLGVALSVTR